MFEAFVNKRLLLASTHYVDAQNDIFEQGLEQRLDLYNKKNSHGSSKKFQSSSEVVEKLVQSSKTKIGALIKRTSSSFSQRVAQNDTAASGELHQQQQQMNVPAVEPQPTPQRRNQMNLSFL